MAKRKQQKVQKQQQIQQQKQRQQNNSNKKNNHNNNNSIGLIKINRTERKGGLHDFPSTMPVQKSSIGLGKSCKPHFRSLDWRKQIQLCPSARLLNAYSALVDRSWPHAETDLQTSISKCYSFSVETKFNIYAVGAVCRSL